MIEITSDAIERVGTLLADVPKGAERVFASAMNRGISQSEDTGNKAGKNRIRRKWRSTDESNQNKYNKSQHRKPCGLCFIFWRKNTAVQIQSHTNKTRNRKTGAGSSQKRWQRDTI